MKMMKTIAICIALVAGPALAADAPSFVVVGAAGESRTLGVADLQKLTVREVSVADPHSKQPSRYRGVALSAVLSLVGVPSGEALRGKALASMVQVEALDGYRVVFSLAELDAGTGSTDAVVVFELDGKPLGGEIGAFRIVVPTDKRSARWVRQVARIKVVQPSAP